MEQGANFLRLIKRSLIQEKYIWHRLEGLQSNTFECDSNKFELGKHFWRVQKCLEFLWRTGKRLKKLWARFWGPNLKYKIHGIILQVCLNVNYSSLIILGGYML